MTAAPDAALPLAVFHSHRRRLIAMENERAGRQQLLHNAAHLPPVPRAIITAYFEAGLPLRELAALHGVSPRQMRRRLDRLRETLADPCFLLAAQYAPKLPHDLQALAKAYWIEGLALRELAQLRRQTLHRIRSQIALARSLLLVSLASEKRITQERAQAALDPRG